MGGRRICFACSSGRAMIFSHCALPARAIVASRVSSTSGILDLLDTRHFCALPAECFSRGGRLPPMGEYKTSQRDAEAAKGGFFMKRFPRYNGSKV